MNNRTMFRALKNNAAAGYQGPMEIELLNGAGLLQLLRTHLSKIFLKIKKERLITKR